MSEQKCGCTWTCHRDESGRYVGCITICDKCAAASVKESYWVQSGDDYVEVDFSPQVKT